MELKTIVPLTIMSLAFSLPVWSQTDYTSKINNPSFETKDAVGWTKKNLSSQGNTAFKLKAGSVYLEKWTGKGGKVGDAFLQQTVTELPAGQYTLTVAAQNIQEDTPTEHQTGATIFGNGQTTAVGVTSDYTVNFSVIDGTATIGFQATGASGNWIAVDNFRLAKTGDDLSNELKKEIEAAETLYGDGTGTYATVLKTTIDEARKVANDASATAEVQAKVILKLRKEETNFKLADASADNPLDMTEYVENPSFETDGTSGWTNQNMGTQGNSAFSIKKGNTYVEKWTGKGGKVGDALLCQTVKNLPLGTYRLKAAAQNIQEDTPSTKQSGAVIFANNNEEAVETRKVYTLDFVNCSGEVTLGFRAEGATGNWIAVDNFQLYYISNDFSAIHDGLQLLVTTAQELATKHMHADCLKALTDAVSAAQPLLAQTNSDGFEPVALALEKAIEKAKSSAKAYESLKDAIDEATALLSASSSENKEEYQHAIQEAKDVYGDTAKTEEELAAAVSALDVAGFAFRIASGTGKEPIVTTDTRYARGATQAFGRSTVNANGTKIMEQGFCWSENPEPKVTDARSSSYFDNNGRIYRMTDLKPATVYYVRAYAITTDYAVGYGDAIKIITLPKGKVTWGYNNGGDEATNDRLNYAISTAVDTYWNNLTNIEGFGTWVTYSPGTPTADCSYGGSMRVGASVSYQSPGTIFHEMLHGIGVGTHGRWGVLKPGAWVGDRVNELLQFWDNNTTEQLHGDSQHMWPYGINGAHEDNHSPQLYTINSLIAQALGEDGLPCSSQRGFGSPAYVFDQEDTIKYYIKNEDKSRGLTSSYLVETKTHGLKWQTMSTDRALENDSVAWFITFNPKNQYYQLRNAATGYYVTYSTKFATAKRSTPSSAENFHLMRSRVDVDLKGVKNLRGYWLIHPESRIDPPTMNAATNGTVGSAGFDIGDKATMQRWLLLSGKEAKALDASIMATNVDELKTLIKNIRTLAETPHTESAAGTDEALNNELAHIETAMDEVKTADEVSALITRAQEACMSFLSMAMPLSTDQPFDLTFMIVNPNFDTDGTQGWTCASNPGYSYQENEYYQTTFDFYQNLAYMPAGSYKLKVQAFQRPGDAEAVLTNYTKGNSNVSTYIYLGSKTAAVKNIMEEAQEQAIGTGNKKLSNSTYIPDNMQSASQYFAKGLYDNEVEKDHATDAAAFRLGIRGTKTDTRYWSLFDNFRLYFYGNAKNANAIHGVENKTAINGHIYTLTGVDLGVDSRNLPAGVYIQNGRKIIIK